MKKQGKTKGQKPAADSTKSGATELTEDALKEVSGGRKAGGTQQEYLTYTFTNTAISG